MLPPHKGNNVDWLAKIHVDLSTSDTCQVNCKFGHSERLSGKCQQLHPNYCGRAPGLARSAKTVTGGGSCSNPEDHCATPITKSTCGARLEVPLPIAETRPWHGVCFAHAINAGAFWWDVFFHSPLNMGKNFTFNATFHFFSIFACKLGMHGILSFYKCIGMFLVFVSLDNEKLQSTTTKSRNRKIQGTRIVGLRGRWPQKGGTGINSFPGLPQVMIKATGTHPSVLKSKWSIHLRLLFRGTYRMRSWPYKNHWHQFLCLNELQNLTNYLWQSTHRAFKNYRRKILPPPPDQQKKTVTSLVFHQPSLKQEIPQWHSFAGQLLLLSLIKIHHFPI